MSDTKFTGLLPITLSVAVPLRIEELKQVPFTELMARRPQLVKMIAFHGDDILYHSKRPGDSAKAFNALADAIAVLSFAPGGVTLFGEHWQSKHPDLSGTTSESADDTL